ncbi:hypothetical protein vseg_019235 [Gypsophila vaccaria]
MLAVQLVLLVAMLIFTLILRWTLKNDDSKKPLLPHLLPHHFPEFQSPMPSFRAYSTNDDDNNNNNKPSPPAPPPYECALCCAFTSTRCSRCKAVRYCSSKCQIMHWRQGHKYDCHPSTTNVSDGDYLHGSVETFEQCETNGFDSTGDVQKPSKGTSGQAHFNTTNSHDMMPRLSTVTNDPVDLTSRSSQPVEHESPVVDDSNSTMSCTKDESNYVDVTASSGLVSPDLVHSTKKLNREQSTLTDRRKSRASKVDNLSGKKKVNSSEVFVSGDVHHRESTEALDVDLSQSEEHEYSQISERIVAESFPGTESGNSSMKPRNRGVSNRLAHLGLKSSLQKVVYSFKASHQKKPPHHNSLHATSEKHNNKAMLQYDTFLKLYSSNEVELKPFGLINCGNSCYANSVLQCLAYTRPLTLYLLQGFHSKECWKEEWCFICEFEHLIRKAREGYTPLSPIRILSNITHLGHGREEDAHEFLRYAVDTMQSVCVELARSVGQMVEDTTLVSMTFGGYLHSKIKCMKCHNKSAMYERMMDLTVEIDGNIRSLEQALRRFTGYEMLEGNNKYHCSRCKSYEKAKKKLSVLQAPNILTIVLKRFQAGTLTKLSKLVQFPQNLDMAPFMSRRSSDGYPRYNLYAVVVHLDVKNAAFCGHYVCYVKSYHGEWFKIDDSVVIRVDLESVLAEEAYILLYSRQSPRPTVSSKDVFDSKLPNAYHHAVPTGVSSKSGIPKSTHTTSCDPVAMQYQSSRKGYAKDSPYLEEWVTHSVESIPRVNSSSEASSLFSFSEEGTCSTPTTKESASAEDFTDYIFSSAG